MQKHKNNKQVEGKYENWFNSIQNNKSPGDENNGGKVYAM